MGAVKWFLGQEAAGWRGAYFSLVWGTTSPAPFYLCREWSCHWVSRPNRTSCSVLPCMWMSTSLGKLLESSMFAMLSRCIDPVLCTTDSISSYGWTLYFLHQWPAAPWTTLILARPSWEGFHSCTGVLSPRCETDRPWDLSLSLWHVIGATLLIPL
jgi:hypothetical protein